MCVTAFEIVPQFLAIIFLFLTVFFLFAFQFGKFLLTCLQAHWFFPWPLPVYWWGYQKCFFLVLLISWISFWFWVSIYLFTLPICSCILCIFSNRFFSILIIVTLNSIYLLIPKPIYLRSLVLMVALSLQSVVLLLACLLIFFVESWTWCIS